jgi:hypothetical protein
MRNRQVVGVVRNHASESYDNDNNGREYPTNGVDSALYIDLILLPWPFFLDDHRGDRRCRVQLAAWRRISIANKLAGEARL